MASDTSTVAYIYKHTYSGDLGDLARRRHTLLAKLTKTGGFTGTDFKYPAKYANPLLNTLAQWEQAAQKTAAEKIEPKKD